MRNFNIQKQIIDLGLETLIANCKGLSVLDVGCGERITLPKYLNGKGFDAYGIDSAPSENYSKLFNQDILDIWPNKGCIPVEKNSYDLVVAHQNPILNASLTRLREFLSQNYMHDLEEETILASKIIYEIERVTKDNGVMIIYPAVDLIENYLGNFLDHKAIHLEKQKVKGISFHEAISIDGDVVMDFSSSFLYRTILYKQNTSMNLKEACGLFFIDNPANNFDKRVMELF